MKEVWDVAARFERHRGSCEKNAGTETAPFALEDLVVNALLDLLHLPMMRVRDNFKGGDVDMNPSEEELPGAREKWAGIGEKPPTVSEFCREVGKPFAWTLNWVLKRGPSS